MKKVNNNFWIASFIAILTIAVFYNFFFKDLYPYPGNYMISWYEPWKSDHIINQTITLAHKAVADDTFRQLFPYRLLTADLLKNFELPLWNPYNGSGMPLMATMHSGFLNPFNVLFIFLSPHLGWSWHIIIQFILLCIFTYLYCRSIKLNPIASLLSSSIFALSGFVIVRLIFGEYIYVIACLPLLLYLIESFVQNSKSKKIFFLPLSIFFIFISGQPQMIFYILITAICYAIYKIKNIRFLLFFFLQVIFGIGLSAIQLLPTFELYQNANITTESSRFIFSRFLLPLQHLITIIIPNYFGNQATYNYWGTGDYIETITAIGSIPCFFVFLSLWTKNKEHKTLKNFYIIILLITIISTLGFFATRSFFSLPIPILSTGIPSRIFVLTSFSMAILAGIGFEKLVTDKISLRNLFYKTSPFLAIFILILITTSMLLLSHSACPNNSSIISCRTVALRNTIIEAVTFLIFILTLLISWFRNKNFPKYMQLLTLFLVVAIGVYNANKFLPFSAAETFNPKNDLVNALQTKTQDGRVFGFDDANIKTDFATSFRFYDPNYYDPLYNKRYGELVAYANNKNLLRSDVEINSSATLSAELRFKRERLLNLLAVKYFVFKKSQNPLQDKNNLLWENNTWYIKKNIDAMDHVLLVNDYEIISDNKKLLNELFYASFDFKHKAIVEKQINFSANNKAGIKNEVKLLSYKENKILLSSSTSEDKILVLLDNYYPGWKAYIDKKPTDIFRTDYTFRGIILPKGEHTILFIYQPDSIKFGFYLSVLALAIYILYFLVATKTKFKNKTNQ
ncbi:YfhO family protein [Candidatus Roizmanbacteria bacterium]|nr:YfhO family protein [Candidatus Roizmanbacteria bacterium]